MEASPLKSNFHARSNSLPSRPHPLIQQCNEHLERLSASQETSSSSSSSSILSHKLQGLQDLHECVEKLVQLPLTKDTLLQESQENCVDELLDGSLRLLDACTTAKDSIIHTKECMRELQSIMRRKRGEEGVTNEAKKFLNSRKVVRKAIIKALVNLKANAKKCNNFSSNMALVHLLKDVEVVTLSIFESLLQFINGSTHSRQGTWSLVSKLIQNKRTSCAQVIDESEFSQVDASLQSFVVASKCDNIGDLQNQLEKLESCIQDLEEGLEFMFRRLIKTRVALLNILNVH